MLQQQIRIGLVPCRRWRDSKKTVYCNPEVAQAIKREVVGRIRASYENADVRFVDIDFLNDEGLISDVAEAPAVAEHFHRERVDAIFIINCNFGSEEAAGLVGKLVGKPVLLWGPRDKIEANGHRDTDSQCGLFAISRQLQRYRVPFSYIENCRVDDPPFAEGLRRFFAVTRMIKNFKDMRVALVGSRPKAFYSVIYNEGELLERFGIETIPVSGSQAVVDLRALYERTDKKKDAVAEFRAKYDTGDLDEDTVWRNACFLQFYRDVASKNDCRVVASECAPNLLQAFGAMPCPAMSLLADEGLIVACEADVLGAVSMALLAAAAGPGAAPMFGEFTMRHPENDNAELLWHCGAMPFCLKKEGCRAQVLPNTRNAFAMEGKGEFTVCRFASAEGKYHLLAGAARAVPGPATYGTGLWLEFDNLPKWERRLIEGPYIHHLAEIPGNYVAELREFARYYPEIQVDLP